ncbi:MAG: HDOD domain-containing protein [Nitrosomonadales bacterium]
MNTKTITISDLVKDVGDLVTLPDVFFRINQLIEDPDSTLDDITKAVSQDTSFAVRLLRIANSPLYGFSSTIDTVSRAIALIGTSQIRNLALSTSVLRTFAGLPNELVSMDNFWRHSLYCGLVARILTGRMRNSDPEAVFTAGLLHDIGKLVIFNRLPELSRESLSIVRDSGDGLPVYQAERQTMGFDHAQVGGELARQWHLPPLLQDCITYHHDIRQAQYCPRETAIVHIANILAKMVEVDTLDLADVPPIDPHAWEITGLDAERVIESTLHDLREEIDEAQQLFLVN